MAEQNKDNKTPQTKAGMMEEADSQTATETDEKALESTSDNTPSISKEKAERREADKPSH